MTEAFFQIGRRGGFGAVLPLLLARMIQFAWLTATNSASVIRVPFGAGGFRMRIKPLGRREGSRGIFLFRERYEPLLRYGAELVEPGDVVFDLGANQGVFCCAFASAVGPRGRVVAVEPIPHQAERVRGNIALNGFSNCIVEERAISDQVGNARLHVGHGDTAASIVGGGTSDVIDVETTTIDTLVRKHDLQRVDFIKIDVEGAELMALKGAEDTLRRFTPGLSLEAADPAEFERIRTYLAPLGYAFCLYDEAGRLQPATETLTQLEDNVICLSQRALDEARARQVMSAP